MVQGKLYTHMYECIYIYVYLDQGESDWCFCNIKVQC